MEVAIKSRPDLISYIQVLKPRETSLIFFIGACSAICAAATLNGVFPIADFTVTLLAIILGSAGANGLTNYLDRNVDVKMKRTCNRVLPSKRIDPPERALYLAIMLIIIGLVLAWLLSPICFYIGLIGVVSSAIWRKTISCTFLGIIAGSAPVLVGWYAITKQPVIGLMPIMLFAMIALWTPLHVWTLMMSNRKDYENAGLRYFPLNMSDNTIIIILTILAIVLSFVTVAGYFLTTLFSWFYLSIASILSLIIIIASFRLLFSPTSRNAWTVYKLSAFPYLGIIFIIMALDSWLI